MCVYLGDLSFTTSLLLDHGCASITSTTFDSAEELVAKYPHVTSALKTIEETEQTLFHSIDATKLSSYKALKTRGPFDKIFFMFPHVGGKSTNINKQVRANQALLVGFFGSAKKLLRQGGEGNGGGGGGGEEASILVTLFEGEPYTLWNIRDLARHEGLSVKRSWRFEREVYPMYKHARTLGVVLKKGAREGDGEGDEEVVESETAWRGELREARTYEFGIKVPEEAKQDLSEATGGNDIPLGKRGSKGKGTDNGKRKWNEDDSTDED
jgi:25S rRNA (uracil2634-N3)-methyltransferase